MLRTALFALIVGCLLGAGEWAVRRYVPNPYRTKAERMEHGPMPRSIVLGNSHSYYGVRPDMLPAPAVSLANVSQPLAYDLELLRHYEALGRLDSLRFIVAQVSFTSLFDKDFEDTPEWYRCINYKLYMGLDRHPALSRYGFELARPGVYGAKLKSLAGIGEAALLCDSLGFGLGYTRERRGEAWASNGADIAAYHNAGADTTRVAANIAVLDSIVAIGRRHGAMTLLFTQPEWTTYRSAADPAKLALMQRSMKDFAATHGVTWLDLYDDHRFGADDFYDADHLNTDGATRLTHLLAERIRAEEAAATSPKQQPQVPTQ